MKIGGFIGDCRHTGHCVASLSSLGASDALSDIVRLPAVAADVLPEDIAEERKVRDEVVPTANAFGQVDILCPTPPQSEHGIVMSCQEENQLCPKIACHDMGKCIRSLKGHVHKMEGGHVHLCTGVESTRVNRVLSCAFECCLQVYSSMMCILQVINRMYAGHSCQYV